MTNYLKNVWEIIQANRFWFYLASIIFVAGLLLGTTNAAFGWNLGQELIDQAIEELQELAEEVGEQSFFERMMAIFANNMLVILIMGFSGFFTIAYLPLVVLFFNGFLIGIIFHQIAIADGMFLPFVLGILPHGIFEIPAILLAAAFGIRLGLLWLMPASKGKRIQTLNQSVIETIKVMGVVFVLLLVAAFIEGGVLFELIARE